MFYNTTSESGQQLLRFRQIAMTQYDRVLSYYKARPGELVPPSRVWRDSGLEAEGVPLTSIRRAIADLTRDDWLVKTTVKMTGVYRHPEHAWTYPTEQAA